MRDSPRRAARRCFPPANLGTFRALRNRVNALLDTARNDYFSLNSAPSPARLWSELHSLALAKSRSSTLPTDLPSISSTPSFPLFISLLSLLIHPLLRHRWPSISTPSTPPPPPHRPPYPIHLLSTSCTSLLTSSRKRSPGAHRMPLVLTISVVVSSTTASLFFSFLSSNF